MANSPAVDTSSLLTILGVAAAVWALVSPIAKLRIQFCMSRRDWLIVGGALLLVHYLAFSQVLQKMGVYYSFGPWMWGFDSSSCIYLILLSVTGYSLWKTLSPKLAPEKIHVFHQLVENLLLSKRYDELILLVEPQIEVLDKYVKNSPWSIRIIDRLVDLTTARFDDSAELELKLGASREGYFVAWRRRLDVARRAILAVDQRSSRSQELIISIATHPNFIRHAATVNPYFCLKLVNLNFENFSEFTSAYIDSMLDASGGRLYVELKNNQNIARGGRLYIPDRNRLLKQLFSNPASCVQRGIDTAIGEAVYKRLADDSDLVERLNKPLGSYYDYGRFDCPVNSGITLFEIMVHEGIHAGIQDHMWLHYFGNFSRRIIKNMRTGQVAIDAASEWDTPCHYLLDRMVGISLDWVEQAYWVRDLDGSVADDDAGAVFDKYFISRQSVILFGSLLASIISAEEISDDFKVAVLERAIRCIKRLRGVQCLGDLEKGVEQAMLGKDSFAVSSSYRSDLMRLLPRVDFVLIAAIPALYSLLTPYEMEEA